MLDSKEQLLLPPEHDDKLNQGDSQTLLPYKLYTDCHSQPPDSIPLSPPQPPTSPPPLPTPSPPRSHRDREPPLPPTSPQPLYPTAQPSPSPRAILSPPLTILATPSPLYALCLTQTALFAGAADGTIREFSLPDLTHRRSLQLHSQRRGPNSPTTTAQPHKSAAPAARVTSLAVHSSRRVCATTADGSLASYSTVSGGHVRTVAGAHDDRAVNAILNVPVADDTGSPGRLYTAGDDGAINEWEGKSLRRVWRLGGGAAVAVPEGEAGSGGASAASGGSGVDRLMCLVVKDGALYSAGSAGVVRVWDMQTGEWKYEGVQGARQMVDFRRIVCS
ncbi:hypothetical protein BDK51DRAFT_38530 [Blyttiomyces helicus]|uniref:WD40-repeat-containing domain protein n=1 Tax=Blyttiomyces helicus TaxID=388810 RepID=A0A4P9VYB6_9FUNG|nr:hypothetical protein BDK51DRAFT_38530 [Blyttiomyces helicus]|eukprot:RKO84771.1 hypothetical protein BDK51DRAFT_38530 [Blyttiomyces helicus]